MYVAVVLVPILTVMEILTQIVLSDLITLLYLCILTTIVCRIKHVAVFCRSIRWRALPRVLPSKKGSPRSKIAV